MYFTAGWISNRRTQYALTLNGIENISTAFNISKKIIVPSFGNITSNQISYKNEKDIVTEIDIAVELELSMYLQKLLREKMRIQFTVPSSWKQSHIRCHPRCRFHFGKKAAK